MVINKEGNIVITTTVDIDEMLYRRAALIDLIQQRNKDYIDRDPVYWAMEILRDMEPTQSQWEKLLKQKGVSHE